MSQIQDKPTKKKEPNKRTKTILILLLILLLLIIGLLIYLYFIQQEAIKISVNVSENQQDINVPTRVRVLDSDKDETYTEIMGYGMLDIDKDYPLVYLSNPTNNDVYIQYDVIYNDELIYSTGLIEPGKMETFNVYDCVDAGEHTLTYSVSTYDLKTMEIYWSGLQQIQKIYVRK